MEGDHLDHEYGFIDPWMEIAKSAKEAVVNDYADEDFDAQCIMCEKASIQVSLKNLKTFPWVKERYDAGNLFIHGWYFDIEHISGTHENIIYLECLPLPENKIQKRVAINVTLNQSP